MLNFNKNSITSTSLLREDNKVSRQKATNTKKKIYLLFLTAIVTIFSISLVTSCTSNETTDESNFSSSESSLSDVSEYYLNTGKEKCTYCNGTGTRACLTCDGKGYLETTVTTPKYSGASSSGGTKTTTKSCSNILCSNGQVECSFCGGAGYR